VIGGGSERRHVTFEAIVFEARGSNGASVASDTRKGCPHECDHEFRESIVRERGLGQMMLAPAGRLLWGTFGAGPFLVAVCGCARQFCLVLTGGLSAAFCGRGPMEGAISARGMLGDESFP